MPRVCIRNTHTHTQTEGPEINHTFRRFLQLCFARIRIAKIICELRWLLFTVKKAHMQIANFFLVFFHKSTTTFPESFMSFEKLRCLNPASCDYSCANKISLHISLFANIHKCCTQFLFKNGFINHRQLGLWWRWRTFCKNKICFFFHWIHFY